MTESILMHGDNPLVYPGYDHGLTGNFIVRDTFITYLTIEDRPPLYEVCNPEKYGDDIVYQIVNRRDTNIKLFRMGSHFQGMR